MDPESFEISEARIKFGNSSWEGLNKMPIDKPYAYHKPSPEGLDKINRLREHFSEGDRLMKEICPQSRQLSVAITNNEQTAMWAIKAVVFNDPNSEVDPT